VVDAHDVVAHLEQFSGPVMENVESAARNCGIGGPYLGDDESPGLAPEQRPADPIFELPELAADCAMCNSQLSGSTHSRPVTNRCFKGLHGIEGRQFSGQSASL
jgi:hypothetical protein